MVTGIRKKLALAGVGAAGVVALGLAVPSLAYAEPDPTPATSASSVTPDRTRHDQKRAERQNRLAESLAKELGIPQDQVAAALEKVRGEFEASAKAERQARLKKRLATAVADGRLTQEQADAIVAAAEAGVLRGGGFGHGPGGFGR